ncbi:MAG TPA: peptide chain release factor N(5)-glutamine methyltransferase, partial [Bacillota bacterium]
AGIEAASLEARAMAGHVLGLAAADVALIGEQVLDAARAAAAERLLRRRAGGEPLQYVVGTAEFWSLTFEVTPAVLIPRPETEHLVEAALDHLRSRATSRPRIADLGTGSGAVAAALAHELPAARLWAVDIDAGALAVARRNLMRLGLSARVVLLRGSWCRPLLAAGLRNGLDVVVSNPPYVAPSEAGGLPADVRYFEPAVALFSDGDPLSAYREILVDAPRLLRPGGLLAFEAAPHRAADVAALLEANPRLTGIQVHSDYGGRPRIVTALRTPAAALRRDSS